MSARLACPDCGLIGDDCVCVRRAIALCTLDDRCQADPGDHDPGCPVEQQLRDELGF